MPYRHCEEVYGAVKGKISMIKHAASHSVTTKKLLPISISITTTIGYMLNITIIYSVGTPWFDDYRNTLCVKQVNVHMYKIFL